MDKKALIERLATFIPDDAEVDIDISIYRPVDDFSVYRFYGIPEGWRNPARRKNIERCDIKIGFVVVS